VWETPLHKAAEKHSPEIVKLLLDNGALIDALSGGTMSPLLLAVTHGQFQNCKVLLERGANPNMLSHNGTTYYIIFELAVKNQHPAIVEMLLENVVSINARGPTGSTALQVAILIDNRDVIEIGGLQMQRIIESFSTNKLEIMRLLITKGIDIEARFSDGCKSIS